MSDKGRVISVESIPLDIVQEGVYSILQTNKIILLMMLFGTGKLGNMVYQPKRQEALQVHQI